MNWLQNSIAIIVSFLIARVMIDADIHKVYVRLLLKRSGTGFAAFTAGILFTSYFFSIFFSNTVVVLSMVPVIKLVLEGIGDRRQRESVSTVIVLALIYGANIGGMASLTGCPLNIMYAGLIEIYQFPGRENITFFSWLMLGIPVTLVLILISLVVLKPALAKASIDFSVSIPDESGSGRNLKKYTFFFCGNILLLVLLTALQFWLKPKAVLWGFNVIDLAMVLYLCGFLFFGFLLPRGKTAMRKFSKNTLFLLFFVVFFVPIALVEMGKDLISRFRLKGLKDVTHIGQAFTDLFQMIWFFIFKEKRDSLKEKNPDAYVSLNRLIYDLPFFGLFFMGVILGLVYLLVRWGDNPVTPYPDGYALQFLEHISAHLLPMGQGFFVYLLTVIMITIFFTELLNNTAVVLLVLPILIKTASVGHFNPLTALLAVTIAASGAFMTPIATPVNAISFASFSGVSLKKMLAYGFVLNILSGLYITVIFYFFG